MIDMIEFKINKITLRLDFSFFAAIALFLFLDNTGFGMAALCACGLHELSHLAVMTVFGIMPEAVTFYGAGIRITSVAAENAGTLPRFFIMSAGCAANYLAAFLLWMLGYSAAAAINLFTGIFNLLPVGELDGAVLLKMLFLKKCRPENVDRYMKAARMISIFLITAVVILSGGGVSFTLITTALYIFIVCSGQV